MSEVWSCDVRNCILLTVFNKSSQKLIAVGLYVGCALLTIVGQGKSVVGLNLSTILVIG